MQSSSVLLCVVVCASAVIALPPAVGIFGAKPPPYMPPPGAFKAFIPSPQDIAALNALHPTPAPGSPPVPSGPGSAGMPPQIAAMVSKYMTASSAYGPPSAPVKA